MSTMLEPVVCRMTIKRYAEVSGVTEKAVRRRLERGVWIEGRQIIRTPEGGLLVDVRAVSQWEVGK